MAMEMRAFFITARIGVWAALLCCSAVSAIQFDLDASDEKCFSEEINLKGVVLARYHVVSDTTLKISVTVTTPYGGTIHSRDHVTEGDFAFTADEAGDYTACFWAPDATKDDKVIVDLDWKIGISAKDWGGVAKREKIEGVELELVKLADEVRTIHENLLYLRDREEKMRHVNDITNSRMSWFSISSLSICLLVSALQLWHLKSFFTKNKLL